jgi:hypothetical protein
MIDEISPNYGSSAGGNAITIMGSGFDAGTTVQFHSHSPVYDFAVPCDFVSTTELECVVPAWPGNGGASTWIQTSKPIDVVVTAAIGSETLAAGYTYQALRINSVAPDHGPTTGGNVVTITGYNFKPLATMADPVVRYRYDDAEHHQFYIILTLISATDTEIKVEMPARPAAETGWISVQNEFVESTLRGYSYESVSLSLSVSPSDIGFTVAPGGGRGYGYAVATVETDSPSGYNLTLESNGADLVCEDNASYTIPSIATDGALTIAANNHGAWAWNVNTVPAEPSSWRTIPTGTPAQIANTSAQSATNGDDYNLYFGAVADNTQPACRYKQNLTITAVGN